MLMADGVCSEIFLSVLILDTVRVTVAGSSNYIHKFHVTAENRFGKWLSAFVFVQRVNRCECIHKDF